MGNYILKMDKEISKMSMKEKKQSIIDKWDKLSKTEQKIMIILGIKPNNKKIEKKDVERKMIIQSNTQIDT